MQAVGSADTSPQAHATMRDVERKRNNMETFKFSWRCSHECNVATTDNVVKD